MRSGPRRCFVISPIGEANSPVRKSADDVFESIIVPALRELKVEPMRADMMTGPGSINAQMLEAILDYDFCIAVVTGHNPNVFYELALAQAAERPVIILRKQGDQIPFDIKDWRQIEYDLEPRSIRENTWGKALQNHVKVVLQSDYQAPKLLHGRSWSSSEVRSYLLNARSKELKDAPRYLDVIEEAKAYCDVMGVALPSWNSEDARGALRSLNERRVPTRILVMDDEHAGLAPMMGAGLLTETAESVKSRTAAVLKSFGDIARAAASLEVRRLRKGMPHFQLVVTERMALVQQYMCARAADSSPLQAFSSRSELHEAFRDEFNLLWDANGP
jgi:hypothetical protein